MSLPTKCLLSLIFLTPVVAFSQTKVTSKDVKIISALATDFSSGVAREGSEGVRGVQYEIRGVVRAKNGVVIDSLITEKGSFPVETIVGLRRNLNAELIRKSDTVQIVVRVTNDKSAAAISSATRAAISKLTKSKRQFSFLLYRTNGKRCLVQIPEFIKSAREPNQ
jgi:hypothetical protein